MSGHFYKKNNNSCIWKWERHESVAFWALGVEKVEEKSHSSAQQSSSMQRWHNEMAMQACSSQACQMSSQNVSVATDLSTHDICLPRVQGFQCPKATTTKSSQQPTILHPNWFSCCPGRPRELICLHCHPMAHIILIVP